MHRSNARVSELYDEGQLHRRVYSEMMVLPFRCPSDRLLPDCLSTSFRMPRERRPTDSYALARLDFERYFVKNTGSILRCAVQYNSLFSIPPSACSIFDLPASSERRVSRPSAHRLRASMPAGLHRQWPLVLARLTSTVVCAPSCAIVSAKCTYALLGATHLFPEDHGVRF